MIHFFLAFNRQGKLRLTKWYSYFTDHDRRQHIRQVCARVLSRASSMCNIVEWNSGKIVYKRYASLYFALFVDWDDNELIALEIIQHVVVAFDRYFDKVCELDFVFRFVEAHHVLDEVIMAGECQESSVKEVMKACVRADENPEEASQVATVTGTDLEQTLRDAGLLHD